MLSCVLVFSFNMNSGEIKHIGTAAARQRLLVILGQIQTYIFQIELLKRCDPEVLRRYMNPLKLNALTIRFLSRKLFPALGNQARHIQTPLTYAVWIALRYASIEGERLIDVATTFIDRSFLEFFKETMKLEAPCEYHKTLNLTTYGGNVITEMRFLHDLENFLKQLNYCHLITSFGSALRVMEDIDMFMVKTLGGGFIVPPELFDPMQPCSICFEELCVTANQGEAVHRRLLGCICDHLTRQMSLKIEEDYLVKHLPYIPGLVDEKRNAAQAAIEKIEAGRRKAIDNHSKNDLTDNLADALLDTHNVFKSAPKSLYAVSELKFWLASAGLDGVERRTIDSFTDNLQTLSLREQHVRLQIVTAELALFGRSMNHFERVVGEGLVDFDIIDNLMIGSYVISPDDQLGALIRACYDHHLSTPLLRQLTNPDKSDKEALKQLLERIGNNQESSNEEECLDDHIETQSQSDRAIDSPEGCNVLPQRSWDKLLERAASDAAHRRRLYAERLSKRSLASLGRCVREQRRELEKTLRVNVYGDTLIHTYVSVYNGFCARRAFCDTAARAGMVIDNRYNESVFDSHSFMKASLLRHSIDPSLLPSLTHKFFELVNGPLFDHDSHNFAQPPNTAFYFSVENVGLLPHLKEELAGFMLTSTRGGWTVSKFQRFYYFGDDTSGVTTTQRLAWKYIRELILASAIFSSVFHCGEVKLLRSDRTRPANTGTQICPPGIYLTYEESCPLVAILGSGDEGVVGRDTVAIFDRDVFSLLYSVLQRLAPDMVTDRRD
ncbi:DNA packaging terminase subunit 2 [Felid alphaherpesvirus 1]|nr:DNA packaging terminase subunit 2 [Felid alphaherpesvirus 1]AVW81026.1 DNA packaging terminase subunit 2 [Felid alphaherpesvirus 1]AVW81180.1 DNA packaging terminase subunit 2 [Felid alphaherpesvirus 1]